ncbi:hypothetical protein BaRGS_00019295, partial [Batillaria attramentaria]
TQRARPRVVVTATSLSAGRSTPFRPLMPKQDWGKRWPPETGAQLHRADCPGTQDSRVPERN